MTHRRLMVAVAIALVFVIAALAPLGASGSEATDPRPYRVYLDPGHGGSDPGAVYDEGGIYLEEQEINLDVALAVEALLEGELGEGVAVELSRRDNGTYLTNEDRYDGANAFGADVLVSIHTNSVLQNRETTDGSMALYFHEDDGVLARTIYDVMYPYLGDTRPHTDPFIDWGLSKFASGVLMRSYMPATMLEPVCMSHPAEAAALVQTISECPAPTGEDCRRAQIARAIVDGILTYREANPPVDDTEPPQHPGKGKPPAGKR